MQRPAGTTQAQIVCSGCRTLLLYPAGATNVRCARCQTITSAAPPPQPGDMAQLCCSNAQCRVVLMYPHGAGQVQCSVCGNLNDASQANQLGHIVCGGCQVTLAYAYGAQSVKCAVCSYVTPVSSTSGTQPALQQQHAAAHLQQQQQQQSQHAPQQQLAGGGGKQTQTVLVENPAGVDETNIAVGTAEKPAGA